MQVIDWYRYFGSGVNSAAYARALWDEAGQKMVLLTDATLIPFKSSAVTCSVITQLSQDYGAALTMSFADLVKVLK